MTTPNPYESTATVPHSSEADGIRRVDIRVFDTIGRGWQMISGHYWMLTLACVVAYAVGSLIPFGLILGAMMVGVVYALMQVERFGRFDLGVVFKGFDRFVESLIVMLCTLAIGIVVTLPAVVLVFLAMLVAANLGEAGDGAPLIGIGLIALSSIALTAIVFLSYLPLVFGFYLVADRDCDGMQAVTLSWRGVWRNFGGILRLHLICSLITTIGAMACYVGAILFLPLSFATYFVVYRDIYGPGTASPPPLDIHGGAAGGPSAIGPSA